MSDYADQKFEETSLAYDVNQDKHDGDKVV